MTDDGIETQSTFQQRCLEPAIEPDASAVGQDTLQRREPPYSEQLARATQELQTARPLCGATS